MEDFRKCSLNDSNVVFREDGPSLRQCVANRTTFKEGKQCNDVYQAERQDMRVKVKHLVQTLVLRYSVRVEP